MLRLALPGQPIRNVGVLLLEGGSRLHWMFRNDWETLAPPEDAEVLAQIDHDFQLRAQEMGGEQFLLTIEDQLSNVLRLSERQSINCGDAQKALRDLFTQHCLT